MFSSLLQALVSAYQKISQYCDFSKLFNFDFISAKFYVLNYFVSLPFNSFPDHLWLSWTEGPASTTAEFYQ